MEQARLTFPMADEFRLEIRRTPISSSKTGPECAADALAQAEETSCRQLEILHGEREGEVRGWRDEESSDPYSHRRTGGSGGWDD